MSKTYLCPYGGFDIPGLEGWLAAMAAKGLHFEATFGPLCRFEQKSAEELSFHLEPMQGTVSEDAELNAIYEDAGWRYCGMFRRSYYVFSSSDPQATAHTDAETLCYALGRFLRWKLLLGALLVLANVLLLGLYHDGAMWEINLTELRYFPVETLSNGTTIPFLLALLGLIPVDASYLIGLCHLAQYRRAIKNNAPVRGHRGAGWLLAVGLLILLPVFVNTIELFAGADYRPYELAGSGFVTMADIEGEDFRLTGNSMFNMDYISHGGTLLSPEYWGFRQYGAIRTDQSYSDAPHLEVRIVRYPLECLAQQRVNEYSRQSFNFAGEYETRDAADECLFASREGFTHVSEISDQTQTFLPGGVLILRSGNTVLFADYYGEQALDEHIEKFVKMMACL